MGLQFQTDGGAAATSALGLIVLQADETVEPELRTVFDEPGVALYHSRIPSDPEVTPETLARMEADLPRTAALLPQAAGLAAIGYGCTSGATVIGARKVAALIQSAHPDARVTDPLTAVIAACRAMSVRRLAFITPYIAAVSQAMREALEAADLEIGAFASFEQAEEQIVARIAPQSVLDAVCGIGSDDCDAVFLSCTNLRSFAIIEAAEDAIDKPVISSNSALGWHMRTIAGLPTASHGPGRLYANA